MRFTFRPTADGSLTLFDLEAGECFKSRHAAKTESEHVFFQPAYAQNPWRGQASPFRVLELGFGLGTNFLHFAERGFAGEFLSVERDLAGARFYLTQESSTELALLVERGEWAQGPMQARLLVEDFLSALTHLRQEGYLAHAILFDPFSPKANPAAWTTELFRTAAAVLAPEGRLVTYSVSRIAKDSAVSAGLVPEKRKLPPELKKRSALLATKPPSTAENLASSMLN